MRAAGVGRKEVDSPADPDGPPVPMQALVYRRRMGRIDWSRALAQPKIDGLRCLVRRSAGGGLVAFSDTGRVLRVPHITGLPVLAALLPGVGEVLDGVLWRRGMSRRQIASCCRGRSCSAGQVAYHVCDLVSPEDHVRRYVALLSRLRAWDGPDGAVCLVESVKVRGHDELMVAQAYFLDQGYAGAMLRYGSAGYEAGVRSAHLLEVANFRDGLFEVVDYKPGRGRHAGVPVFTCVTPSGHWFDVLAPGTPAEKKAFGGSAGAYVGCLLLVRYQEYARSGEPVPVRPVALGFVGSSEKG